MDLNQNLSHSNGNGGPLNSKSIPSSWFTIFRVPKSKKWNGFEFCWLHI